MIVRLGITDHCNIACFISILLIEQKLQAPDSMSYLIHSKSHQSGNIFACSDIEHGTQGDILQDVKENLVIMPSCHHAICHHAPPPPSQRLMSGGDWAGWGWWCWVDQPPAVCSVISPGYQWPGSAWQPRVSSWVLSVGWRNVWPLSPAAAMGTHVGGEIVRRIADTVISIQPGTSGDTWTLTHTRTLMGPVPVGGICCGFFSLHLMFLANNQMI